MKAPWHCECCGQRNSGFNTYCAQGCDDDTDEPVPAHPDDVAERYLSLVKDVDNLREA